MGNTREAVAAVISTLRRAGIRCDLFGGWAEEILGLREPRQHGDIDLIYRGESFVPFDLGLRAMGEDAVEVPLKRFRHKRAFRFHETLCEVTLVQSADERPVTLYWGDVPFFWDHPLVHGSSVHVCGEAISVVSAANLRRHRIHRKEIQPHRWYHPESLEPY